MYRTRYFCQIFTELLCYRHIFEKYSYAKFHENPFRDNRVVPYGMTDRDDETSSPFSQFSNAPQKDINKNDEHIYNLNKKIFCFICGRVCSCRIHRTFRGVCCMYLQDSYTSVRTTCHTYTYTRYTLTSNQMNITLTL